MQAAGAAAPVAALRAHVDHCVQCGLCLPHCPTYAAARIESESPRGRLQLMRAALDGALAADPRLLGHLDACLGCGRCAAVCPAGVDYLGALEGSRRHGLIDPARRARALRWARLLGAPGIVRSLATLLLAVPTRWRARLVAVPKPWGWLLAGPERSEHPRARPRSTDAPLIVFPGCASSTLDAAALDALVHLLDHLQQPAMIPPGPLCCGALAQHVGDHARATSIAAPALAQLRRAGAVEVVGLASGCQRVLTEHLRPLGIRYVDAASWLADGQRGERLEFRPYPKQVALHVPCTAHVIPRALGTWLSLLARIPELRVRVLHSPIGCCGAAGDAWLHDPARTSKMLAPLLDAVRSVQPAAVLTANVGCALLLRAELRSAGIEVLHPLTLLARCLVH